MDHRRIQTGLMIPSEGYADQPYMIQTDEGGWLCTVTTGPGREGATGQHVISVISHDQGKSWSSPVPLEPEAQPSSSYATLLKVPSGRIYCFYTHNTDDIKEVKTEDGQAFTRVDSCGHYVFRYSDDHGRSWSARRYEVPIRLFKCDRDNVYNGKIRFFWGTGRPIVAGGQMILPHHKVGAMGEGFFAQSEGAFIRSPNILTEPDPERIVFETLPLGDVGLRAPSGGGRIAEEQSVVELSDGSLYCVYRTIDGYSACSFSRDCGETWSEPRYTTYNPGGRRFKNPRAANFVWKCGNGKFLYWFHNHGGSIVHRDQAMQSSHEVDLSSSHGSSDPKSPSTRMAWNPYEDRNPVWMSAGTEQDTPEGKIIVWTEPEILLYDDDPYIRMSYPDLIEEGGKFFIAETQKHLGRLHQLDTSLLEGLFTQDEHRQAVADSILIDLPGERDVNRCAMPKLPDFRTRSAEHMDARGIDARGGFAVEMILQLKSFDPGQVLLDTRTAARKGLWIVTTSQETIAIYMSDGRQVAMWECDRGEIKLGQPHHIVINVDGGPHVISYIIDGKLNDGGSHRQFGWGRFSQTLRSANGSSMLRVAPSLNGTISLLRIYGRYLRTSEAVGNYRAALESCDPLRAALITQPA